MAATLERVLRWMHDREEGTQARLETTVMAEEAVRLTKMYAPKRTGALAASVDFSLAPDGESAMIYATAPYAAFVEDGTKPHVIEARNAKALRFRGKDGQFIFRKRVNHPGTAPRKFMERALRETVGEQSRLLGARQEIRRILGRSS